MSKHVPEKKDLPKNIYFFCNREQEELVSNTNELIAITDELEYSKLISENTLSTKSCTGIIILLELLWENKYYVDFFGLDLIYKLRVEKGIFVPIILTSNYPFVSAKGLIYDHYFSKKGYRYLMDPAVQFIPLPQLIKLQLSAISATFDESITNKLLQKDLKENLFGKQGYISNFFHDLQNKIYAWTFPISAEKTTFFFQEKYKELMQVINHEESKNLLSILSKNFYSSNTLFSKDEIIGFINKSRSIASYESEEDIPISLHEQVKTLYIGDQIDIRQNLGERLNNFGINCLIAKNSAEAIKILGNNPNINVLICDFRFNEQRTYEHTTIEIEQNIITPNSDQKTVINRIASEQGYHILDAIYHQCPDIYYPIMLSSFSSDIIQQYFNQNIKPTVIDKQILIRNDAVFSRFAQLIIEKDARVREDKTNLPEFGEHIGLYLEHIQSKEFEEEEQIISRFTLDLLKEIQTNPKFNISPINNSSGGLDGKNNITNLENFRIKLKLRRIAIGLCQIGSSKLKHCDNLSERWSAIYSLIKTGSIDKYRDRSKVQPFISKHLIKMHTNKAYDWRNANQLRLTPKEKEWLIRYGELIETHQLR